MGQRQSLGVYERKVFLDNNYRVPSECKFCAKAADLNELHVIAIKLKSRVCAVINNQLIIADPDGNYEQIKNIPNEDIERAIALMQNKNTNSTRGPGKICHRIKEVIDELEKTGLIVKNIKIEHPEKIPRDLEHIDHRQDLGRWRLNRTFSYGHVDMRGHYDASYNYFGDDFYKVFIYDAQLKPLIKSAEANDNKRSAGLVLFLNNIMASLTKKPLGHAGSCLVDANTRTVWMLEPRNMQDDYDLVKIQSILAPLLKISGYDFCLLPPETVGVQNKECLVTRNFPDVIGYCMAWSILICNTFLYTSMTPLEIMDCLSNTPPCELLHKIIRPMNATINFNIDNYLDPYALPNLKVAR